MNRLFPPEVNPRVAVQRSAQHPGPSWSVANWQVSGIIGATCRLSSNDLLQVS